MIEQSRAVLVVVRGRVQGVGFRYETMRSALLVGLVGWVRNAADGTVVVRAQGPVSAVEQLCAFLEDGPPHAEVTGLEIENVDIDSSLRGFDIR